LSVLTVFGYVEPTDLDGGCTSHRIDSSVLEWYRVSDPGGAGETPSDLRQGAPPLDST